MTTREITVNIDGIKKQITIEYDRSRSTLTATLADGLKKIYTGEDIYICFGLLRKEYPTIKFFCKGSKINVHPSSMSSQMSSGVIAYELTIGESGNTRVNIFDYEDNDLTNEIQDQIDFYTTWSDSLH